MVLIFLFEYMNGTYHDTIAGTTSENGEIQDLVPKWLCGPMDDCGPGWI